jgi:AcrR family transcriptional regulator
MGEFAISASETQSSVSTKEKIFRIAVQMFSDCGYDSVSMRDIAQAVGISAASIYNHYPSKKDILSSMYRFYAEQRLPLLPDKEALLRLAETASIPEALNSVTYYHDPSVQETLDRILIIAAQKMSVDAESAAFVRENMFSDSAEYLVPMLERMIALGRIEPMDVHGFACLWDYYCFGTAVLNHSSLKIGLENWKANLALISSMIHPK